MDHTYSTRSKTRKMALSFLPTDFNIANIEDDSDTEVVMESMQNGLALFSQNSDSEISNSQQSSCSSTKENVVNEDNINTDSGPSSQYNIDSFLNNVGNGQYDERFDRNMFVAMHSSPKANTRIPFASLLNPVTPPKISSLGPCDENDPLTPTANLKMLISAASPEIRNLDRRKEQAKQQQLEEAIRDMKTEKTSSQEGADQDDDRESVQGGGRRKEKSLGLLCQRFLARFPEYPGVNESIEICLDEVAKDLNVERRRIYDIVNVLESVELVSRVAKNKYAWHGKSNLKHTLSKLQALGKEEGFAEQMDQVKSVEMSTCGKNERRGAGRYTSANKMAHAGGKTALKFTDETHIASDATFRAHLRKDKSLGIMSQKFLMMFLSSKNKTVNLDMSAKVIIGDPNIDKTENNKFKTKIRRLYDIANILTSLGLIRKVHVTEVRGRKPAFKYIGPELDDCVKDVHACSTDGCHRPSSRHSLLDCVKNPSVSYLTGAKTEPSSFTKQLFTGQIKNESVSDINKPSLSQSSKSSFTRHSSFEVICEAAEQERRKLYGHQPSSPEFQWPAGFLNKKFTTQTKDTKDSESNCDGNSKKSKEGFKYYVVIRNNKTNKDSVENMTVLSGSDDDSIDQSSSVISVHKVPITTNEKGERVASLIKVKNSSEPVIIRKRVTKPKLVISSNNQQMTSLLRGSLVEADDASTPKPMISSKCVDVATQMSPDFDKISSNEEERSCQGNGFKRLMSHDKLVEKEMKRYKVDTATDAVSECQDAEVEKINRHPSLTRRINARKSRPSPLRALHLEPEFTARQAASSEAQAALREYELASPFPSDVSENSDSGMESLKDESNSRPPSTAGRNTQRQSVKTCHQSAQNAAVSASQTVGAAPTMPGVPTMRLSNTSSPVMLLSRPSSVSSLMELDLSSMQPIANLAQLALLNNTNSTVSNPSYLSHSNSQSPTVYTFGSAGVSSLRQQSGGGSSPVLPLNCHMTKTPVSFVSNVIKDSPIDLSSQTVSPLNLTTVKPNVKVSELSSGLDTNTFLSPDERMQFAIDQRTPSTSVIRNINPLLGAASCGTLISPLCGSAPGRTLISPLCGSAPGRTLISPLCGSVPGAQQIFIRKSSGLVPMVSPVNVFPATQTAKVAQTAVAPSAFQAVAPNSSNAHNFNAARKLELVNFQH